jgi:acyl transferase domain-containing protein
LDSSHEQTGEQALVLTTLGKLWLGGIKPDWDGFYANEKRRRIPLPTYPFERKRHWVEPISATVGTKLTPAAIPAADPDVSPGDLEEIIQQQLRLMNDQLALIQANEGSQPSQ